MITPIDNLDQLRARKELLTLEVNEAKTNLMYEIYALEQSLSPANLVINGAKKLFSQSDSFAGNLISNSIGTLASSTLFGGASWPLKWILTKATKNLTSHLIEDNRGYLLSKVASLFSKKPKTEPHLLEEQIK